LGGIGGDGVDVDAAEPADLDGFEIAGADERPCGRPADAELFGGLVDGQQQTGLGCRYGQRVGCLDEDRREVGEQGI